MKDHVGEVNVAIYIGKYDMGSYTCLSGIDSGVVLSLTWCGAVTGMDIMEESPPHQHLMYYFTCSLCPQYRRSCARMLQY